MKKKTLEMIYKLSPSIVFAQEAPTSAAAAAAAPDPAAKAPPGSSFNYDECKVRPYTLPDLFTFADGRTLWKWLNANGPKVKDAARVMCLQRNRSTLRI